MVSFTAPPVFVLINVDIYANWAAVFSGFYSHGVQLVDKGIGYIVHLILSREFNGEQ